MSEVDGAQIKQTQDPRLTRILSALGAISVVILGAVFGYAGWVGNRVADRLDALNTTVTRLVERDVNVNARLDQNDRVDVRQDVQLNELSRDVAVIEGRVLRGQHPLQEGGRGN